MKSQIFFAVMVFIAFFTAVAAQNATLDSGSEISEGFGVSDNSSEPEGSEESIIEVQVFQEDEPKQDNLSDNSSTTEYDIDPNITNSSLSFDNSTANTSTTNCTNDEVQEQPALSDESMINFISIPDNISFGEVVEVGLQIYKGDTKKYVIKVYFQEISNLSKINVYGKHINMTHNFSLQLVDNSNCAFKSKEYLLFAEGLDVLVNKTVFVNSGCAENPKEADAEEGDEEKDIELEGEEPAEELTPNSKVAFSIVDFPESLFVNESFMVKVKFEGNGQDNHVEVFSYVYKNSKSYSGDREANKEVFVLKAGEDRVVPLGVTILEYGEGLKLKVRIKFNDRKTYDEITLDVVVEERGAEEEIQPAPAAGLEDEGKNGQEGSEKEGIEKAIEVSAAQKIFPGIGDNEIINLEKEVVYKSKSLRSLDIALYCIIGVLSAILGLVLFKKDF